jgi:hypothetical protein
MLEVVALKVPALIVDTVSIQKYIFSSNKLKENIGASYIVENAFNEPLKNALKKTFGKIDFDLESWRKDPDTLLLENGTPFEILYSGGGNLVIAFREKEKVNEFVRAFSRELLVAAPGLRTSFGFNLDFDTDKFKQSMKALHEDLRRNKNRFHPIISLRKYGITADCPRSDESAEFFRDGDQYVSSVSNTKMKSADKANQKLSSLVADVLKDRFAFTDEIDLLGQVESESNYVAIVHIDGNSMGKRFAEIDSLFGLRKLSASVSKATQDSFMEMTRYLIELIEKERLTEKNGFKLRRKDGKTILPIRPIIIGGDDITFVCHGKLGLILAWIFISSLEKKQLSDKKGITACAGVCIAKSKYPFYRSYLLAEELTSIAKAESRKNGGSSYLDFHLATTGFSGSLDEIRDKQLSATEGNLHFGPYKVTHENEAGTLCSLLSIVSNFAEGKWPNNKIMKLRERLFDSQEQIRNFIEETKSQGLSLPEIPHESYARDVWINSKTPYYDAIELMEFLPEKPLEVIECDLK